MESKRVKPIIQSYSIAPSFVQKQNDSSGGTRPILYRQQAQSYYPKRHQFSSSSRSRLPNYYGNSIRPTQFVPRGPKRSSKVWIRPSETIAAPALASSSSSSNSVKPLELLRKTEVISNPKKIVGNVQLNSVQAQQGNSRIVIPSTNINVSKSGHSGPIKPIVLLNKRMRFRRVQESRPPIVSAADKPSCSSSSMKVMYKLDRRVKLSPKKGLGFDIARSTIIGGLSLSERRSTFAANARKSIYKFTASKVNSPKSFIVRKYSLKRIRKISYGDTSKEVSTPPGCSRLSSKFSQNGETSVGGSKLELSSLSLSQNSTVRLATRVVQRSRQHLAASKRKKNTFCDFYNRFGICKRKDEGNCSFVHDPRQLQLCPSFLTSGTCNTKDCKLSHDLKVGKIPACRFFNEGSCSREACKYLHVLTNSKKKLKQCNVKRPSSEEHPRSLKRKRTDSITEKKEVLKPVSDSHMKPEEKNRYFEMSPDSQPIVAIIPRRYPKGVLAAVQASEEKINESSSDDSDSNSSSTSDSSGGDTTKSTELVSCGNNSVDTRRERLLGKLSKLKKDLGQKPSKAPSFLGFNSK